jgi:hypothetical protein
VATAAALDMVMIATGGSTSSAQTNRGIWRVNVVNEMRCTAGTAIINGVR